MAVDPEKMLRCIMQEHNLDAFLTFTADSHLNEYIGPQDQRVQRLTGFSGSNGIAITCDEPCLLTDPRYYIQAANESTYPLCKDPLSVYIAGKGYKRVGLDPRFISSRGFKRYAEALEKNGVALVGVAEDEPCDRPTSSLVYLERIKLQDFLSFPGAGDKIVEHLNSMGLRDFGQNVTGSHYKDKIERVRRVAGDRRLIVTELDTICWILNIRAFDIEYNPVVYSFLAIDSGSAVLFTDHQVDIEGIAVRKYFEFEQFLNSIKDERVLVSGDCNYFIYSQFEDIELTDEIRSMQASKNETELAGMALSYFYDGVGLTNLFGYMASSAGFTERDIADKLDQLKRGLPGYVGPSFETIACTGTNSAIVHHSCTDAVVDKSRVFLLDSGSHYYFGTTDTTRTMLFGDVRSAAGDNNNDDECAMANFDKNNDRIDFTDNIISVDENNNTICDTDHSEDSLIHDNTLVFKGQITAMMKCYASDAKYADIDDISRSFLKKEEKDFGHATGHGVGHFLCVHEHPPTIASKSELALCASHVFSIEPGYYREGEYGIRIENLVFSRAASSGMELVNITMVPYQLRMLEARALTQEEKEYVNEFSRRCYALLKDCVTPEGLAFLEENTQMIK